MLKERNVYTVEQKGTLGWGRMGGWKRGCSLLCFHFSAQLLPPVRSHSLSSSRTF